MDEFWVSKEKPWQCGALAWVNQELCFFQKSYFQWPKPAGMFNRFWVKTWSRLIHIEILEQIRHQNKPNKHLLLSREGWTD